MNREELIEKAAKAGARILYEAEPRGSLMHDRDWDAAGRATRSIFMSRARPVVTATLAVFEEGAHPADAHALMRVVEQAGLTEDQADRAIQIGARFVAHGFTGHDIDQMILNHYAPTKTNIPPASMSVSGQIPTDDEVRLATLAAVKKGAKSDAEAVRNYQEAERVIRAAIPHLHRTVQGEPPDAGKGWFEWFKMPENTTEIAYVYENGDVFDPARGWNPPEFVIAAAEGRVFRLVRAAAVQGGETR